MILIVRFLAIVLVATISTLGLSQKLEPYDSLHLCFPGLACNCMEFDIGPAGAATLPYIGNVVLAGLPIEEAARRLSERFEAQLRTPLGSIQLRRIFNAAAPIRYSGALERSGETFPSRGLRLSELLRRAGPTAAADLEAVEVRSFDGVRQVAARFSEDSATWDFELRAGDRVFVPERKGGIQVYVLGAAARPGAVDFARGLTVRAAIDKVGGLRGDGDPARVEIHRRQKLLGVVDLALGDAPLEAGDVIHIQRKSDPEYVYVMGAVLRPNRYPRTENMTLLKAIEAAGGIPFGLPKPTAILVRRENGKTTEKRYDLMALARREVDDPVLRRGDRVEILEPPR